MTGMRIRQCTRCELRFTSSSELEYHLANDHRPRQSLDNRGVVPPAPVVPASVPSETRRIPDPPRSPRPLMRIRVILLAGLLLVVVVVVSWLAPASIALITVALVALLALCYRWRARGRAQHASATGISTTVGGRDQASQRRS